MIIFAALLAALPLHPVAKPVPFSEAEKAQMATAVRDKLSDPDSAKFEWFVPFDEYVYCGRVNAKNRMGGYVGFTPFLALHMRDKGRVIVSTVELLTPDNDLTSTYIPMCLEAGYPIAK